MSFSYPVMLDLTGRRCVVLGAGSMAVTKAGELIAAGARVTVIGEDPSDAMQALQAAGRVELQVRAPAPIDLPGAALVVAVPEEIGRVEPLWAEAERLGILFNSVDDVPHCNFAAVSKVRRGDLTVTISTAGKAPALAKHLRKRFEAELPDQYGALVDLLAEARARALPARAGLTFAEWARRWEEAMELDLLGMVSSGELDAARDRVVEVLTRSAGSPPEVPPGKVWIVGAGPGARDLVTQRGLAALAAADVVVYDRLVDPELVAGKEAIYAGKMPGEHSADQQDINRQLVELAQAGKRVVRLKGGDPYVFGRGAEEASALADAGIRFEVVPGVTSAIGALAAAGIPVTDRRMASSVAIVTGHCAGGERAPVDFHALATTVDTIVILMGMANLEIIAKELMAGGLPESTPAAIVHEGTRPQQQSLVADLGSLASAAAERGIGSPSVVVVGAVASLGAVRPPE